MLLSDDADHRPLILDACALINLAATDRMPDILAAVAVPVMVCDTVMNETLYLRRGGRGVDAADRDPIDLTPWIAAGCLQIVSTETDEELEAFVDLATALDDGEAMTIAIAAHRSLVVVTDDRKAARLSAEFVPVESSLALVKAWFEIDGIDAETAQTVLRIIRERARYAPHAQHPLRAWWDTIVDDIP